MKIEKVIKKSCRNRNAGHQLERNIVTTLKKLGFEHLVTTRSESRNRDNDKIDIMNKNEAVNGRLPYNIQAKNYSCSLDYSKLLEELPKGLEVNVIIHNQTKKSCSGRFITKGQYALLNAKDFFKLIAELNKLKT